ncbi:MAG: radical SAM protein [Coriobacteriales bacterium]|nr:radical SAM protein [Coriobacteriales bacterium]
MPSVYLITLGCAKNEVDSNRMRALLRAAGYVQTDEPTLADAVIVNTCAFITEATEEALDVIFDLASSEGVQQGRTKLVVAGCLPARYGGAADGDLAASLPEVDAFISALEEDAVVEVLAGLLGEAAGVEGAAGGAGISAGKAAGEVAAAVGEVTAVGEVAAGACEVAAVGEVAAGEVAAATTVLRIAEGPWAYVKIADGCSRRCSFCTIPDIRGAYRSRPAAEIVAEVDGLVAQGVREIILIAQDTGLWQDRVAPGEGVWAASTDGGAAATATADAGSGVVSATSGTAAGAGTAAKTSVRLHNLLELLAERHPAVWLRLMYLQPQGVTDELLAVMAARPNICNYLDLPLQHADSGILEKMNRQGDAEQYLALLGRVRAVLPDVVLRTTMIAGFPGETSAQAKVSESFIEAAEFDYLGVFVYSREEGTPAGELPDQIPLRTRRARAQRLRDIADVLAVAAGEARVGSILPVLVCGTDEEGPYGRTQGMAPEVDGVVHLSFGSSLPVPGDVVHVRITSVAHYDWYGEVL